MPLILMFTGYIPEFLVLYGSILLHECGHILAAKLLGRKISSIKILPVGLNATIDDRPGCRWERLLIYISGPLANVLLFTALMLINSYYLYQTDNMRFFILVNICLAIFNLIPVLPLDGGRILGEVLASQIGLFSAGLYIRKISLFIAILLFALGIIQLFSSNHNFSLFLIGFYVFFSLKSEERSVAIMNVKHIIYRRSRLLKRGIYPARDLVVIKSVRLGEIIKNLDFDRFHFIYVLDEELKLIRVFSEQEIIDGMLKYNTELTFEEFIEKST